MQSVCVTKAKAYYIIPPRKYDCYSRNIQSNYRYHYKGDLPECGLKIKQMTVIKCHIAI